MPAAAIIMGEERMRSLFWIGILAVKRFGQDSNISWLVWHDGVRRSVEAILEREEHGSCGEHDSGIV